MAAIYSTPVINLDAVEATLGADMLGLGVTAISFPFALWLGLVAGSQQIKGHPTLKRLLWGVFLGILFSGFLVSAATTEEVVTYRALQGIEVAGGSFDFIADSSNEVLYADSNNEEWLEQHVRVSRKPWFSRPLVVVGPVLGLFLGLIVPRRLRWGETAPRPWRLALWLVIFLALFGILVVLPILGLLAVVSV